MPLANDANKGKYPQRVQDALTVNTISNSSCISQVYADKHKQSMQYALGLQKAIPPAIPHDIGRGNKTLLINMQTRLAVKLKTLNLLT